MAITLAVGTTVAIASAFGAVKNVTAASNNANMVLTLEASHGVIVGDYVTVSSGWDRLNGRVIRATAVATNDVTFAGIDTSNTTLYPVGTGTGTVKEVTTWVTIGQITSEISVSGGEQQFADITTLTDNIQKQIPTVRNPIQVTLPLFDDPSLGFVPVVRAASETATVTPALFSYPNGSKLAAGAYWSYQDVPTIQDSTLRSSVDMTFTALPSRYTT